MKPIAKKINNEIYPLDENIVSSKVEYIMTSDEIGWNILRRGLTFIFIVACKKLDAQSEVKLMHSLNKGIYCKVKSETVLTVENIKNEMIKLIEKDLTFKNIRMPKNEVLELLKTENNKKDKYYLFAHKDVDIVELNELDGVYDFF